MKIGKIDLMEPILKFWDHPDRNRAIYAWIGFSVLYIPLILVLAFSGFIVEFLDPDSLSIFFILFCGMYFLIIGVSILSNIFATGSAIYQFGEYKRGEYSINVFKNMKKKLSMGLKYFLVALIYSLPLFLLIFILIFVLVLGIGVLESVGEEFFIIFMLVFMVVYMIFLLLATGFQYLWRFVASPVVYKFIVENKFAKCFSPRLIWKEVKIRQKSFLNMFLSVFLLNFLWGIIYMVVYMLSYVLIGLFVLPIAFAAFYILRIYIEPYIFEQVLTEVPK